MGFHTFDADRAAALESVDRYQWCSAEELRSQVAPHGNARLADLGSGTGFYTDVVAPYAGQVYAVDLQSEMHALYEQKGVPENVSLVRAPVETLPFADNSLDAAFSTMTYHEFSGDDAVAELGRVLRPGGRLVTVDWSNNGQGAAGPPLDQRHGLAHPVAAVQEVGFTVDYAASRAETFVCRARR